MGEDIPKRGGEEKRKKERDVGVFYIKGREKKKKKKKMKKKRCVYYEISDSSLLIELSYRQFY